MVKQLTFLFLAPLILLGHFSTVFAQDSNPILLTGPEDWRYEKIDFPLDFAPEIDYEGFEELRFAPGMFDQASETYFTYVFALSINRSSKFKKGEIEQILAQYYRGLCAAVASSKGLDIDASQITVHINKAKSRKSNLKTYRSEVLFFDAFNTGEEVLLQMELEIFRDKAQGKSQILALVSPQAYTSALWKKLYQIRLDLGF